LSDGSPIEIDVRLVDELMPDLVGHDRHPSAFIVYLYLVRRIRGTGPALHRMSLATIAEGTGLSKRTVQNAISRLKKRKLIIVERGGPSEAPRYALGSDYV